MNGARSPADKRGFLVAYPNGTGFLKYLTWNVGGNCCGSALKGEVDDVAFLLAIVEDVRRAAHIDVRRVYVAGFSDGGMLAFRAACDAADKIAAIGVVAGRMPDISCKPKRPVPLIIFTGSKDPDVNTDFDRYITPQSFGYARGVDSTLAFWTHMNGCAAAPALVMEGRHVRRTWRQCRARSRVVSYTVTDAAHEWPGAKRDGSDNGTVRDLSATEHMLDFFGPRQLARPNPRRPRSAPAALVRKDTVSVRRNVNEVEIKPVAPSTQTKVEVQRESFQPE